MSKLKLPKAALAVSILTLALYAADNPFVGTWKLNAAKSKVGDSGLGSTGTVKIESEGAGLKVAVDTTDAQGQPVKFTYQATLDGKPGTATGAPNFDTITIQRVNDHTLNVTGKKDGKVMFTDRRVVSHDGKTLTLSRSGTNAQGKPFKATLVFDRQ